MIWDIPCFPIRAAAPEDEAPLSRFFRRARENGLQDAWDLFREAGFKDQGSWTDPAVMERIQEHYGLAENRLFDWRRGVRDGLEIRIGNGWIPRRHVDFRGMAVCPRCLEEGQYRRALWDVRSFLCCPRHGLWLINACRQCGAPVDLLTSRIAECPNGHDFRMFIGNQAPDHAIEYHGRLEQAAGFGDGQSRSFDDELSKLTLFDLLALGLVLGPHPTDWDLLEAPQGKEHWEFRRCIDGAAARLSDWPYGFRKAVSASVAKARTRAALSMAWRNGSIHYSLYERLRGPQFAFMRAEFEALGEEMWALYGTAGNEQPQDGNAATQDLLGLSDAAFLLGLDRGGTKRLLRAGLIEPVSDYDKGEGPHWVLTRDSIDSLERTFLEAFDPPPARGYRVGMPFDSARNAFSLWKNGLPGLIGAVGTGRIPVVGMDEKRQGLRRFILDFRCLADFLLAGKRPDERVGWRAAMMLLGLKNAPADWLAAKGILTKEGEWPHVTCSVGDLRNAAADVIILRRVEFGSETGIPSRPSNPKKLDIRYLGSPANDCPVFLCERETLDEFVARCVERTSNSCCRRLKEPGESVRDA